MLACRTAGSKRGKLGDLDQPACAGVAEQDEFSGGPDVLGGRQNATYRSMYKERF